MPRNMAQACIVVNAGGVYQILLGCGMIGTLCVDPSPFSVIAGFHVGRISFLDRQTLLSSPAPVARAVPLVPFRIWPAVLRTSIPRPLGHRDRIPAVAVARGQARKYVPPPLAALAVGTLLAVVWLRGTRVIGEVPTGLPQIQWPVWSPDMLAKSISPAITMALLGSIDSLLTSLVADAMTRTRHNPDRELIGQGVGNLMSGLIGGVPGAGSTVGTVVNLRAGGRTGLSG